MLTFKTGDLIARAHPNISNPLQVGLVVDDDHDTFSVKWFWYNKEFYIEKEEDIIKEWNKSFLLDTVLLCRKDTDPFLCLVKSNYTNGQVRQNSKTP